MQPLPETATDADLIAFVDRWAGLLEREDYAAAFDMIEHEPGWSPSLIRQIIKSYGEAREDQRVTVAGVPSDVCQRKNMDRWPEDGSGYVGEIWYDLNIDGVMSDLTATFRVERAPGGLVVWLNDIHVM